MERHVDEPAANADECRKVSFPSLLHLKAEVLDHGNVLAVRNQPLNVFGHEDVSTDFPVKQGNGSIKWYEEFPTKTDPISGVSLLKENDLYTLDQKTGKRSEAPIDRNSEEYKEANESLAVLRAKYTPGVILSLPSCKIE